MKYNKDQNPQWFEKREKKILECAAKLFGKNGFRGTTTKSIAKAAQINEALLYKHFPTKKKLYSTLIEARMHYWKTELYPRLKNCFSLPLREALIKSTQIIFHSIKKNPYPFRIMFFAALENHPTARLFFDEKPILVTAFEELFAEKQEKKEIAKANVETLAGMFWMLLCQCIVAKEIFQVKKIKHLSEKDLITPYLDLFLKGVTS